MDRKSRTLSRERPATLNHADQQHHERNHQQNVDEPANSVGTYDSEQPKDQQDHKNGPKHKKLLSFSLLPISTQQLPRQSAGFT
jgi:hypothetical protein